MAKGGSTSKTRPGAGTPAGEQMADQIAFIQINQETHVFFRNHFKQITHLRIPRSIPAHSMCAMAESEFIWFRKYPSVIRHARDRYSLSH
jgi:hypothetical protein